MKLTSTDLPITTTAQNIDFEFYWEKKCEEEQEKASADPESGKHRIKNVKTNMHGGSYK